MLRLDDDLTDLYRRAEGDPDLAWITAGAGRMLRAPTVFEDVVKTICTTNCSWSATQRMVGAIVGQLGEQAADSAHRAFPSARAMAAAGEAWYVEVARAGYRARSFRELADAEASGQLDLAALDAAPDDEAAERFLALRGVGPYAAAHLLLVRGHASRVVYDSWTRPTTARLLGKAALTDAQIARRFRRYGPWAGLAHWLFLTRDWVDAPPV